MKIFNIKWICALLFILVTACQAPEAGEQFFAFPRATKADLHQAINIYFWPLFQHKDECLGRLLFSVDRAMAWALSSSTNSYKDGRMAVSREIKDGSERVLYGKYGLYINVYPNASSKEQERLYDKSTFGRYEAERQSKELLELKSSMIKELKSISPAMRDPNVIQKDIDESVRAYEREIAEAKQNLKDLDKYYRPLNLGLPGSMGYMEGSTLHGLLLKDAVLYDFNFSWDNRDTRTPAQREAWFLDLFKRFQTRKLHEIPKARGVCIPYGFIPDDGTVPFYTSVGFRYDDRPNVLYTIRTQVVDDSPITNTLLEASTRAAVGLMPGVANEEAAKHLKKRIGPHRAYIGELAAEQGGVAVQLTEGDRTFDNYSVFTGYNGWMNSHVLPFISVDMRSFTQEQTQRSSIERLKTDPPPFEESKTRLDAFLKSIRLRPTDQVMPELQ